MASASDPPAALIAVLAGGRGERLGGDKPGAELAGKPLIHYPLAAAEAAADRVGGPRPIVVAKPGSELPALRRRVLLEPERPVHPLCGIVAALREVQGSAVVALACDMPFVPAELLAWLAGLDAPLAVPRGGGRLHPLLARYDASLLAPLEAALEAELPLRRAVASLGPREIGERELLPFGDPARLLLNVNTRDELAAAERLVAGAGS